MAYIGSNSISIFPSAKRGVEYPYARLTVEATFPNIINKLLDSNGFVITEAMNADTPIEFNIYGYYVKVNTFGSITSALFPSGNPAVGTVIYAQITIDNLNEITGQDTDGTYRGVKFDSHTSRDLSQFETATVHNQLLCEWNGTSWIIPEQARLTFNYKSIANLNIDGGVISV